MEEKNYLYRVLPGDKSIWVIYILLSIFSIALVYSATGSLAYKERGGNIEYYLLKQVLLIGVGFGVTFFISKMKYSLFSNIAPSLIIIAVILLMYTLAFGMEINDARRWIKIPIINISFQSSDFAKLSLIIFLARSIAIRQDKIKGFKTGFLPLVAPVIIICGLIAPADLSSAMMLFVTSVALLIVGRINFKYILGLIGLGIIAFALLLIVGNFFPEIIRIDTWITRMKEWFGFIEPSYQIAKSKIAIVQGGIGGLGPGNSVQRNFLPSPYSDFVYAIIWEEYGAIGGLTILVVFGWFFYRAVNIVTSEHTKTFGALVVMGLSLSIIIQALANMAVSVNLVPVTGLTLPLISMGGTSLLFFSIGLGIILSVSEFMNQSVLRKEKKMARDNATVEE